MRGPRRPGQRPFAARAEKCLWNGREIDLGHNILSLKLLFRLGHNAGGIPRGWSRQMRAAILGGGPGGLYFAISLKLRDPAHEIVVVERNRPGDTFGWGVVLSDETLDNLDDNDPESAAAIRGVLCLLGRHRRAFPRHGDALVRPRLLRHRAQAAAQHSAGPRPCARRRAQVRDRGHRSRRLQGLRPRRRRRRHQFARAHDLCRRLQARHRHARLQVHLARHPSEIRRRLHLHLRGDRARLDLGARLSVRCRHRDLHRRVLRADLAQLRLRRHERRADDRGLARRSSPTISAAIR